MPGPNDPPPTWLSLRKWPLVRAWFRLHCGADAGDRFAGFELVARGAAPPAVRTADTSESSVGLPSESCFSPA